MSRAIKRGGHILDLIFKFRHPLISILINLNQVEFSLSATARSSSAKMKFSLVWTTMIGALAVTTAARSHRRAEIFMTTDTGKVYKQWVETAGDGKQTRYKLTGNSKTQPLSLQRRWPARDV